MKPPAPPRSIGDLRDLTPARVGLGRSGVSLPTSALLDFTLDHARARDAVHAAFDAAALVTGISELGLRAIEVKSRAGGSRRLYLGRPDLGRRLDEASAQHLVDLGDSARRRVVIVIGDGLSPTAVHAHALGLMRHLLSQLSSAQIEIGPIVVATGARVALGDEIGELLGASLVAMLIGERPGLSAPDSLGAYLTFAPKLGRTDADRNCVSNIHRAGLAYAEAAFKIVWLIGEGISRKVTGVALKDESGDRTPQHIADKSSPA
ncbi:MAG TPA: ethanolamine ammonia-lyase subunit EutC [Bradyrhizobium sp.]|nr:ethanolamine ammonia-lyase subunit EutC [Bradyrhizobium sp.]